MGCGAAQRASKSDGENMDITLRIIFDEETIFDEEGRVELHGFVYSLPNGWQVEGVEAWLQGLGFPVCPDENPLVRIEINSVERERVSADRENLKTVLFACLGLPDDWDVLGVRQLLYGEGFKQIEEIGIDGWTLEVL